MGMSVGKEDDEGAVLSEINTTPLVDVMLVLLIIFLITIPVVTTSIQVDLPKQKNQIRETKPENIVISVDTAGGIYWFDSKVTGKEDLLNRMRKIAKMDPQPEIQIRGDGRANYESVGRVLFAAQKIGIAKVGFITEPPPNN
jgi:biopolymer transport protein ExbD